MGIVPTMYRASTMEHRQNLNMLKKQFGPLVWRPIPQRTIWAEASSRHQPVFALVPDSQASTDIWHLVDHVEEGLKNAN
jgi:cellulose biosynthesis protein BcsQ